MYIRCPACRASTRIDLAAQARAMTCPTCGGSYPLLQLGRLGATPAERSHRADVYSREQGIDLASAYSVLLGIMTREDALPFGAATDGSAERIDRVAFASQLAQKHDLSLYEAFLVADKRMSLEEAVRRRVPTQRPDVELEVHGRLWDRATAVAAVLVVLLGAGIWIRAGRFVRGATLATAAVPLARPVPVPSIKASTEVRTNAAGELIGIRALDPDSVLATYCASVHGRGRPIPVRVSAGYGGDRLGVFRQGGVLQAIRIRKATGSSDWIAGDGREPIVPVAPTAVAANSTSLASVR